jgi:hypothetical protein
MPYSTKKFKVIYQIIIIFIGMTSVLLHIIFSAEPLITLVKFTIQSNILVSLVFTYNVFILLTNKPESNLLQYCKNAILIYTIMTGLTYHLILSRAGTTYFGPRIITNIVLHYIIPIMIIVNWFLFEKKKLYSYKNIIYWLVFPIFYCVASLIRGTIDGFYPYFFLNPNGNIPVGVGNYKNVVVFIFGFISLFAFFGLLLILGNKFIIRFKRLNH